MTEAAGRFDQSFVIRMIRDFLIALTIIIVLELGGRLFLAMWSFQQRDREKTELAATRLASDVREIMLNRGGPVAARTVYPIIERNHNELGLEIAIVPSEMTVEAIRRTFGFEPRGILPHWSEGPHHEAMVELEADEFCITCHVTAGPGDVLGYVTVRSYRASRMGEWWREARVVSVVGMANIILHTIVLFLLLRLRMEPLLRLRSTVARLAKGRLDLSQRAEPRSSDEFGELAIDLNHFLDRVSHVVEDLDDVLNKVSAVNERLGSVSGQMGKQMEAVQEKTRSALQHTARIQREATEPSREAIESLDLVLSTLERISQAGDVPDQLQEKARNVVSRFRDSASRTRESLDQLEELTSLLGDLDRVVQDDAHYMGELLLLEERMRVVSQSGQVLLARLPGAREERGERGESSG